MADMRAQLAEIAKEISGQPSQPKVDSNQEGQPENEQEETEEQEQLPGAETQPEEEGISEEEQSDHGHSEIKDLKGLVEAIEVEPEWLYGLEVPMGDNEPAVPLGKLKDELVAVRRKARDLESQLIQAKEMPGINPGGQLSEEAVTARGQMDYLQRQFDSINWDDPEADKGELAYYRQKLIDEYAKAHRTFEAANQKQSEEIQKTMQGIRDRERQALIEAIPAWKDKAVAETEVRGIIDTAKAYGFRDQDIMNIFDHRILLLLRDFAQAKKIQIESQAIAKKVQKAPKVLGVKGRKVNQKDHVEQLIQRAQNSNRQNRKTNELAAAKAILGIRS